MSNSKVSISHVFKTIVWPRRNILFFGFILIILNRLSSLVLPYQSKYLMDDVITGKDLNGEDQTEVVFSLGPGE